MNKNSAELRTLAQWLEYVESQHSQHIALGLERVNVVRDALGLAAPFAIIAVGGTNGKGSACSMLEAILHHSGYKVGCYTSPHLLRYNERVRINRREAGDADLVRAFDAVDAARAGRDDELGSSLSRAGRVPLTYFEFGTLAAMWLFVRERVDVAILEVGLGGRLDAVNAFDAACAIVTSVDLDHMDYLGPTREHIGLEKAGIFRPGCPAICGARPPPRSMVQHADSIGARLLLRDRDFGFVTGPAQWQYWGPCGKRNGLPYPALRGHHQLANAATCLTALDTLRDRLPVTMDDVRAGLLETENPGRFQVLPGRPVVILDVAHNPEAARALADTLTQMECRGRTIAVFSMLRDKDIAGTIEAVKSQIDHWCIAPLDSPRAAPVEIVAQHLRCRGAAGELSLCAGIEAAYVQACGLAREDDRILAFGSFYTVAAVLQARVARSGASGSRGGATGRNLHAGLSAHGTTDQ